MCKDLSNLNGFEKMSKEQIEDGIKVLNMITWYQTKYNEPDTDRAINAIRDGIASSIIGYDLCNTAKNGFDCADSTNGHLLEVKAVNYSAKSWGATFNDTTEKKALSFTDKNVYLQVPLWVEAGKISFFMIGNNPEVGNWLLEKVNHYNKNRKSIRCTQTLSMTKLYKDFGFKIVAVSHTKDQVVKMLRDKHRKAFKYLKVEDIMTVDEYNEWINQNP